MKILIVGSGHSAREIENFNQKLFDLTIVVNHGHLATSDWNVWIHSRDFRGKKPENITDHQQVISNYDQYVQPFGGLAECGKSIMLVASYYALSLCTPPSAIYYLGADMNYTPDAKGHTHIYGVGLDIQKRGKPDPDRMAERYGNNDPKYLEKIYLRFETIAKSQGVNVFNLSSDKNTRLPFTQVSGREFCKYIR